MQAHAIPGPWAAGERVLVCVSSDARHRDVVRYAKRLADRLRAPWTAIHVETGAHAALERGRTRPHRRGDAPGGAAWRRGGDAAGPRCGGRRSSTTRGRTMSPISSSRKSPRSRWRSCSAARWRSSSSARPAASACMCIAAQARSARPRAIAAPTERTASGRPRPYLAARRHGRRGLGVGSLLHQSAGVSPTSRWCS